MEPPHGGLECIKALVFGTFLSMYTYVYTYAEDCFHFFFGTFLAHVYMHNADCFHCFCLPAS